MKQTISLFTLFVLLCLLASCGESHFLTDASYRQRVQQDFRQKQALMPEGNLFALFDADLPVYEREALEFLYAYMPLADVTDYSGEFYRMNVQASLRAAAEMPWGREIPEALFRHFVLPVRVNNEHLDNSRVVFYEELKERVRSLSLYDAILEVNHWCHEKAVYTPSDARTSSPLATVRTAYGRCGEESTFLVAALRSVGIPARQVYTPRWAHTDDNHAWVEAWAGDKWYFLGACEPEPVLDLGWFNAPASRGMLMHTKVFGRYEGPEEVMSVTPNYTEINVIDNYAPTAHASVTVKDAAGRPVPGACVEFKLYNYAEFYTVATKQTDSEGRCGLTAGKGDMLVWASHEGRFGFAPVSFGKQSELTVTLDKQEGDAVEVELDITPPAERADLPQVTPEQRAENDRRMAREDSIRNAYMATMMSAQKARAWVEKFYEGTSQPAALQDEVASFLTASRGNHETLKNFLKNHREADPQTGAVGMRAIWLLKSLSQKDLRDVKPEVLEDHWQYSVDPGAEGEGLYRRALLCPRVSTEELTPYKSFFRQEIDEATASAYREEPQRFVSWCAGQIVLNDTLNSQRIPMSPAGVWKARVADSRSRDIFFVSVARTLGIPAWIDEVTGAVRYRHAGTDYDVRFGRETEAVPPTGRLVAAYRPAASVDNPKYYSHFTLSRIEGGRLQLQNYDEENTSWATLLKEGSELPAGHYLLVSGTRLANGGVLARLLSFAVEAGKRTDIGLALRESSDEVQVIGSFNSESLFTPLQPSGEVSAGKQSLLQACGRGYFVVGVLGVNQEPTNHALRDIAACREALEQWGRKLVLLFPDEAQYRKFSSESFPALPSTCLFGIDSDGIQQQMVEAMKLKHRETLPVFIIADTFNRVVFVSQGYTIGLGEQLMKTIGGL